MGRKIVKVDTLNPEIYKMLESIANLQNSERIKKKIKAIIMSSDGLTSQEISDSLKLSRTTVISYINQCNSNTINFEEISKKNRKSPITFEIGKDVSDTLIDKLPDQEGYNVRKWSCSLISNYIEKKYRLKLSKTAVHSLIKKLGFEVRYGNYLLVHKKKNKEFLDKLFLIDRARNINK